MPTITLTLYARCAQAQVSTAHSQKSVKPTDKPDSVHAGCPARDHHYSGPQVTLRLGATYPHTPGARSGRIGQAAALCVCLLGIAARRDCPFHPILKSARLCCSDPHLIPRTCVRGFQWTAVSCYAALCSPDVPPVRCFHPKLNAWALRLAPAVVWWALQRLLSRFCITI